MHRFGFRYLDDVLRRDDSPLRWCTLSFHTEIEALFKAKMFNNAYKWEVVKFGTTIKQWTVVKSSKKHKRKYREFFCDKCDSYKILVDDDKDNKCLHCGSDTVFERLLV